LYTFPEYLEDYFENIENLTKKEVILEMEKFVNESELVKRNMVDFNPYPELV